jgi:hypothetical protein
MNCFSLKAKNEMISRTSKLLEIYGLVNVEPLQFPKMSYPDNPQVVSTYSYQIYGAKASIIPFKNKNNHTLHISLFLSPSLFQSLSLSLSLSL